METRIVLIVLLIIVLVILARCIRVVQQSKAYVIERLGAFHTVWSVGLHFKIPFIDRVQRVVSLKEQVADFPPQPVITKDNVTIQIDTVLYFQITDPKLYAYGVENPMSAIENLTATTLRNIIGELELDQSLTSRDTINAKMRSILDEATDPWGIKVNRVELKNILPPREIQNAMEKQMKAERERRESILQAEGEKASKVLIAEGEKQSVLLQADAAKQAKIMAAEAEAQSILKVQQAMADSMRLLNENAPNDQVIKLKALEALEKVADGKATKIIIPSEIQGLAGLAASTKALLDSEARGENPNGKITLVVASKPGVFALERAAKAGVEGCVVRRKDYASSEDFDEALLKTLKDHNIDLVVLAGFLSVLGPSVIEAYPRRILNIHPALIPSFCGPGMYGLRPHEAALARGCKVTGATVHFVNEECDGGPILLQKAVDILPGDTPEVLQKRVMEQAEWQLLPLAAERVCAEIVREKEQKND